MNKKGQALVEFVLILPIFILLVFSFIDIGKIILCKNSLESTINDVAFLIKNNADNKEIERYINEDSNYNIKYEVINSEYTKIVLKTKIDLITPGLNKIFDENIKIERSIINE